MQQSGFLDSSQIRISTADGQPAAAPRAARAGSALAAIIAFLFALGLIQTVLFFRPLERWEDLFRYVQRYSIDPYAGMMIPDSLVEYPVAEYGWQLLVRAIFHAGISFETAFTAISILAATLTGYVIVRRTGSALGLLLLINPALIDFFVSQLRSSLAFSIVLLTMYRRLPIALSGIALASTIHTSMLLFVVPLLLNALRPGDEEDDARQQWLWIAAALILATILCASQMLLLEYVGDRRTAYNAIAQSAGMLLTIGWSALAAFCVFLCSRSSNRALLAVAFIAAMFLTSSMLGFYAHRYAAFLVPLMALTALRRDTPPRNKALFLAAYAAFTTVYFGYWL